MRRICAAIAMTIALAGLTAGTGTQHQYVTSMTFQDGVLPTAGYSGCEATYHTTGIAFADSGKNFGACSILRVGGTLATEGESQTLIKFDVTGLPDSAVITNARLWLYQIGPDTNMAPINFEALYVYRLFNAWTEGTGTCSGTTQAASADWSNRTGLAWSSVGAKTPGTANSGRFWAPGTSTADSATAGSFYGSDSLSASTGDITLDKEASSAWKNGTVTARRLGWININVTHQARLWHIGANPNNGLLINMYDSQSTYRLRFASDNYVTDIRRRPKLIIDYIDPEAVESAAGGSVRRYVGRTR